MSNFQYLNIEWPQIFEKAKDIESLDQERNQALTALKDLLNGK